VASTEPWAQGVLSLRGHIVPVYDLADRLGTTSSMGEDSKIVILEIAHQVAGVIVDTVEEVLTIDREHIESARGPIRRSSTRSPRSTTGW
jgi:purine-binding chemotaxis protein CheW